MKNLFKFLMLGLMSIAFIGSAAISSFAQDDCEALDAKIRANYIAKYAGTIDQKKTFVETGKVYLANEKCNVADNAEFVTFLKKYIPLTENNIADTIMYKRFNDSIPAKNWDEAFASGKEIVAKYPDSSLDVAIIVASIGFDNATGLANPAGTKEPVDKFNNDTIVMANWVINHINNKSENYGALGYELKTKDYPDGKSNALGWMNYTIGYINYYRLKNSKAALPYLYKATQINGYPKTIADLYRSIGAWYVEEFNRIGVDRDAKTKAAGDKDTDETLSLLALQKGYAERAMDAYYRAYKLATKDPKAAQSYLDRVKLFYKFRFELKPEEDVKADEFNKYTADMQAKPFPDPMSVVTPIVEAPTATTTPPTGTTTPVTKTTTPVTKTTVTTPVTKTTTPPTGTKTTTPVKKPTPKKKP